MCKSSTATFRLNTGGFTGGVVDAKVKSYEGENKLSFTYSVQRDEWEEFHLTEDDVNSADKWRGVYTPDYEKATFKINAMQAITDDIGMTIGLSRRQSEFAQEYENDADVLTHIQYGDEIDSLMGRITGNIGGFDGGCVVSLRQSFARWIDVDDIYGCVRGKNMKALDLPLKATRHSTTGRCR